LATASRNTPDALYQSPEVPARRRELLVNALYLAGMSTPEAQAAISGLIDQVKDFDRNPNELAVLRRPVAYPTHLPSSPKAAMLFYYFGDFNLINGK
jgi:hypothetical protein